LSLYGLTGVINSKISSDMANYAVSNIAKKSYVYHTFEIRLASPSKTSAY